MCTSGVIDQYFWRKLRIHEKWTIFHINSSSRIFLFDFTYCMAVWKGVLQHHRVNHSRSPYWRLAYLLFYSTLSSSSNDDVIPIDFQTARFPSEIISNSNISLKLCEFNWFGFVLLHLSLCSFQPNRIWCTVDRQHIQSNDFPATFLHVNFRHEFHSQIR